MVLLGLLATGSALNPVDICAPALPDVHLLHAPPARWFEERGRGGEAASLLLIEAMKLEAA